MPTRSAAGGSSRRAGTSHGAVRPLRGIDSAICGVYLRTVKINLIPVTLRGYKRSWLRSDLIAGVTLAAVAIPETMGYTSIAQTPIVTGCTP